METIVFPSHDGARKSLIIVAVLLCILVVTIPFGIWVYFRAIGMKVVLGTDDVVAKGLGSVSFKYTDVERLGVGKVKIIAGGLGGALARQRMGGPVATHIVAKLASGGQRSFAVSQYEKFDEIMQLIATRTGKPFEEMTVGAFGLKFP